MNVNRSVRFYLVLILVIFAICSISFFHTCMISNISLKSHETFVQNEAESIYQRVRIHCTVVYSYPYEIWSVMIKRTWARHCNKVLFVSGNSHGELEPYVPKVNSTERWLLTRMGLNYAYAYESNDIDWFLRVCDSSFVIVENLRQMLKHYSTETPIWFGFKMKDQNGQLYMYDRAGIVLSKEALRRFTEVAVPNSTLCNSAPSNRSDIEIANCLHNVGVFAGDTRDEFGRHTFVPFPLETILSGVFLEKNPWFPNATYYELENNTLPVSKHAITFNTHFLGVNFNYYYFVYKVKHFGMQRRTALLSDKQNALNGILSRPPYA